MIKPTLICVDKDTTIVRRGGKFDLFLKTVNVAGHVEHCTPIYGVSKEFIFEKFGVTV